MIRRQANPTLDIGFSNKNAVRMSVSNNHTQNQVGEQIY